MIAGVFESRGFYDIVAACASTIAVWASTRARTADPIDELTTRLRHPVRWALTHPVQAIERKLNTWFH